MDLAGVNKIVDILYYEGQMNGYEYLIEQQPRLFGGNERAALTESRAIEQQAIQLLQQKNFTDDEWTAIMLYVLTHAVEAKGSVTVSDPSPEITKTNASMHAAFNQIQGNITRKNYKGSAEGMQDVAKWMIATKTPGIDTIKTKIQTNLRTMRQLLSEVEGRQGTAVDSTELAANSGSFSTPSITVATTAAAPVVPPVALTDDEFRQILETETFPDDNVTADLFQFALPINQETPLSDPSLRIHKETMDLLNQLSSYGTHPFFKFNYKQGNLFEIEVKKGSILTYHKPIEIAKVIYGLMHHSETKQIKYPPEIASTQSAALSTLVADINHNFKVLQGELDQLKPKTIKRITEKVFGNPMAKKVGHETRSLPSKSNITKHQERLKQLTAQVKSVLAAKADYNGQLDEHGKLELKADGTPVKKGVKNHHNFYVIENEAENLKRLMRAIKREDHSPNELEQYKAIVAPAQEWSIGKHLFRTVRHRIWDGGKRTRRLRKKK